MLEKKLAIIGTRGYPSFYGGFETAVRHLAPYLASSGWEVTVYCRNGAVPKSENVEYPGISQKFTRGLEFKSLSTLTYGYSSCLDAAKSNFDAALIMNVANGYFLPTLKKAGIPTIVNVDGIEWEREKWGPIAKTIFKNGANLTAKYADDLVFDSQHLGKRWKSEFNREGNFIPYGGELTLPLPLNETDLKPKEYVLFVARFVPENSTPEFFEAVSILAANKVPVVIVGSTGYGGQLDGVASQLQDTYSTVRWLGQLRDDRRLFNLWANAGAYFHGHSVGGTNPALVQAMACGAPTVARDTVYNREVLGETGIFVNPNPHDIAFALMKLIASSGNEVSISAALRKRAKDHYSWESVNYAYEKAIRNLISL